MGRGTHQLPGGHQIGIFTPERTLIDIFRLRHDWGTDLAVTALKAWLARPGNIPATLISMSDSFADARPSLISALEILL